MKRTIRIIAGAAALLAGAGIVTADTTTDYYIQSDTASVAQSGENGIGRFYQDQIDWLLDEGYAPASVILSSVGRGLTLADAVYFMARSRPQEAVRYFEAAELLLPSLPGWACSVDSVMGHRYDSPLTMEDLPGNPTLAEVARQYFDEYRRFITVPDWENGDGHLMVEVEELIGFKQAELDFAGSTEDGEVDSWWYLEQSARPLDVVMVGFYPAQRRVVMDVRMAQLQSLRDSGVQRLPVMVMYNDVNQIPTSDIERVPETPFGGSAMLQEDIEFVDPDDGEITATEVIRRYESDGMRVPPAREWRAGDYHLQVRVEELLALFEVPETDAIAEFDRQQALERLQEPMRPLHLTLYGEADGQRWLDEYNIVRVASEQGIERLPLVFFYHDIARQPCGLPGACLDHVRQAARLATDDVVPLEFKPKTLPFIVPAVGAGAVLEDDSPPPPPPPSPSPS